MDFLSSDENAVFRDLDFIDDESRDSGFESDNEVSCS